MQDARTDPRDSIRTGPRIEGRFDDAEAARSAVEALLSEKIPEDQIDVFAETGSGARDRIEVKGRLGALHGALIGAVAGALLGAVGVAAGMAWFGPDVMFGGGFVLGVVQGAAAGILPGVVVGGLTGLGRWRGSDDLRERLGPGGQAVVVVRGRGLVERARAVLERSGATLSGPPAP